MPVEGSSTVWRGRALLVRRLSPLLWGRRSRSRSGGEVRSSRPSPPCGLVIARAPSGGGAPRSRPSRGAVSPPWPRSPTRSRGGRPRAWRGGSSKPPTACLAAIDHAMGLVPQGWRPARPPESRRVGVLARPSRASLASSGGAVDLVIRDRTQLVAHDRELPPGLARGRQPLTQQCPQP